MEGKLKFLGRREYGKSLDGGRTRNPDGTFEYRENTETIGWREYGKSFNILHLYETNVDDTMANRTFLV